ncbi:MAG: protein-L-isoaspartate(D-aspartate) O-methyltransferase [Planctomycetota bacterium]|nr:protein-L-isoaspartate(D-aspartate) O-methyltransferase [Planctomycetota bacterium]MDA0917537.1 protein-L-isoaspartate(D-aspartate) O-methyltransferase [Planctomycetota bacterium]
MLKPSSNQRNGLTLLKVVLLSTFVVAATLNSANGDDDKYREARAKMVAQDIAGEGITNRLVLQSLNTVERHEFVPSKLFREAYIDKALPIGYQQTISPPFVVAYMTQALDPRPTDKVLEIGTGSGYQAAVLAEIVKEVYSIEIVPQLSREASRRLSKLGYDNVHTLAGDGYKGWPEHAPYDRIIVTCSPESVPQPLIDQLREGGRMIVPLGQRYQQVFYLFEKQNGKLVQEKLIPTLFVPMTGQSEEGRRVLPDPANPQLVNGGLEIDENNDGKVDSWYYQRQAERVKGDAPEGDYYVTFKNDETGRPARMLQGIAIDGRKIAFVNLSLDLKLDNIRAGDEEWEKPAFYIHFYDHIRRSLGDFQVGPWLRSQDWERTGRRIPVPVGAREAILRIGLNGAAGTMSVDDLRLSFIPR